MKKSSLLYFPSFEKKNKVYYIILVMAMLRPIGFLFNSPVIDGIGAATCISPLPTVFSSPGGIEAFTSDFYIVYSKEGNEIDSIKLTSEMFLKMNAPHPYRNAVSLMLGYFPLIEERLAKPLLHYFFYDQMILKEMGVPYSDHYVLINRNKEKEWKIEIHANEK